MEKLILEGKFRGKANRGESETFFLQKGFFSIGDFSDENKNANSPAGH